MEHRHLGDSGLVVSRLALGTMTWGRETDEDEAGAQLTKFLDAGGTLVDTADRYTNGQSETIIGRLIAGSRDDVLIATKAGTPDGPGPLQRGTSRRRLLAALDRSLTRLGVDSVDLWQVHVWDPGTPMEETLGALDIAVSSGRVRYAGISNWNGWQTGAAGAWQRAVPGRTALVSTQVEYSLLERGIEREVLGAAETYGLGILPWSPLGRGVLTGKYSGGPPPDSRGASESFSGFVAPYLNERADRVVHAVTVAAKGLGVSPAAVALAWVRDRPGVVAPVVGARTADQLGESLAAERLSLPVEIQQALDDVSAPVTGYPERTPWG
jgi:aryl-alcohol dehydrogenase-like predicted oxidoreductase